MDGDHCQLEGADVLERSCLDTVQPPWEDPTVTAEDLGPSILAFSPVCAGVSLPPRQQPVSHTATCPQRRAA